MTCRFCKEKAGFFQRVCCDCRKMVDAVGGLQPGVGFRKLLDALADTGASEEKIRRFMTADLGAGSLQDRLTAQLTNDLAAGLGQPSSMTAKDVSRIRREGPKPEE